MPTLGDEIREAWRNATKIEFVAREPSRLEMSLVRIGGMARWFRAGIVLDAIGVDWGQFGVMALKEELFAELAAILGKPIEVFREERGHAGPLLFTVYPA